MLRASNKLELVIESISSVSICPTCPVAPFHTQLTYTTMLHFGTLAPSAVIDEIFLSLFSAHSVLIAREAVFASDIP